MGVEVAVHLDAVVAGSARAGQISPASGGRGLTSTILLGSTAARVQHSAPCPVPVCRPRRPVGT